jgi:hypothetical protein
MAANATATRPAKVRPSKQPPQNSVWIRYHPWIEGVMAHISAWSIHLLVIGGAVLWFTYLAYALGFAKPARSLPMEAVRLEIAGGGGNKEGTGTEKGGNRAPLKEGAADTDKPSEKTNKVDATDRPQLTDVQLKKIDETFAPEDARYIKEVGSMESFANLDKGLRDVLREGVNPSKGNDGTGTGGGTGPGTGTGTGSGAGPGKERKLNEREKRFLRWDIILKTNNGPDMLGKLEALGIVLGIRTGPQSIATIDLSKRPYRLEEKDASTIGKVYWIIVKGGGDVEPNDLMQAMNLPTSPNLFLVAFIPVELEEECGKLELAYHHLRENEILRTAIEIRVPGVGGEKYSLRVVDQKKKK